MGLWGWLTGKRNRVPVRENLWLTSAARQQGICRAIREAAPDTAFILVLAHFPASLDELKQSLTEADIEHDGIGRTLSAGDLEQRRTTNGQPQVLVGLVRQLQPDPFPNPNPDEQARLEVLVSERHFVRRHDERVAEFVASLSRPSQVTFHLSLEDPLLRSIGGDWIQSVLTRLGASEATPIESEMMARRLPGAQERYARRAEQEQEADSAEEWLELNAPGG